MPSALELEKYYEALTDQQLLDLKHDGGFTPEAEQVLARELARRNLGSGDLKRYVAAVQRDQLREEATERGGGYRNPGLQFFGRRFLCEADRRSNIQVRTKWFTISGIPLVPIASYRFKVLTSEHQRVVDRVPLDWMQIFQTWFKTAILLTCVGALIVVIGEIAAHFDHGRH